MWRYVAHFEQNAQDLRFSQITPITLSLLIE
jgi:hypothetical protein